MIGSIVPPAIASSQHMDPLSEVLALMKPQSLASGGFRMPPDIAIHFPKHKGVKCYAMLIGECWLQVESAPAPVLLRAGDCFLLPRGLPFRLTCDLAFEPIDYAQAFSRYGKSDQFSGVAEGTNYMAGGFFAFTGTHADMLLQSLPPIVHIRREQDKAAMRWSLERMREELRDPQPGASLIAQQLAYTMLIQALRLHLADTTSATPGWLAALSDKHMSLAIAAMHNDPGFPWTLHSLAARAGMSRSVFALRFRETVGVTPLEYLTRWRMLLAADRLQDGSDGLSAIAQSLGYESDSAFGKAFRRVMGRSPRQYTRAAQLPGVVSAYPSHARQLGRTQSPALEIGWNANPGIGATPEAPGASSPCASQARSAPILIDRYTVARGGRRQS